MPLPSPEGDSLGGAGTSPHERAKSLRILVTGSSGVIGRSLVPALEAKGHRVILFDLRDPRDAQPSSARSRDVRDLRALLSAVESVDGVVHLAAISRAAPAEADPDLAWRTNVDGTRNVLEALRSNASRAWIVFASSREVYGEPQRLPVDESHPINPKGTYGRTKAEAEKVIRSYCENGARSAMVLRFTNIYGAPHDCPERVVPAFLAAAREGRPLEVRGPDLLLDLLHLDDAVQAVLEAIRCLQERPTEPEAINVASGHGVTLRTLAEKVIALTGSTSPLQVSNPVPWAPSGYVGNVARAAESLSWHPGTQLEEGLRALVSGSRSER